MECSIVPMMGRDVNRVQKAAGSGYTSVVLNRDRVRGSEFGDAGGSEMRRTFRRVDVLQNKASRSVEIRHGQGRGSEHAHPVILALPRLPLWR